MAQSNAWKHDIGSWQSRKALSIRQQQSAPSSMPRDQGVDGAASARQSGFLHRPNKQRSGVVTFGPDFVLPNERGGFAANDVSLSALSDATTQVFDDSMASLRSSVMNELVDAQSQCWVTVFGVPPEQFLDVRATLDEKYGRTLTHHWPACSNACNWLYVEFEQHFDASRAVSMSPLVLTLGGNSSGGAARRIVTIGVEWCRDVTFTRSRDAAAREKDNHLHNVTSSSVLDVSNRSRQLWTSHGQSFVQEANARAVADGLEQSMRRQRKRYLPEPLKGAKSIVDAVVGSSSRSLWLLPMLMLNRRELPEQRLERAVALTAKRHPATVAEAKHKTSSLLIVRASSPWRLWVNLSTILVIVGLIVIWFRQRYLSL